ncbi:MAG TPA: hypothetical protein VFN03_09080 [Trueperaceae bacterium]|nr:hypothetical protein [Trueperaceae bacterium]
MRTLVAVLAVLALPVAFATHFTGTYVDQQNGVTLVLQMQQDGTIQGTLTGPSGTFELQGQGNEQGAFGTAQSTQGALGFQAQLGQDNVTLQIAFFQADQNNQPVQVGGLVLQRSTGAGLPIPGQPGAGQPGMGQPGQMPIVNQPGMPGATQPAFPTAPPAGQPGAGQPGAAQPGMPGAAPGAAQPTFPTAPAGQPGVGQPAQPGLGGGLGGAPAGGQAAMPVSDWNGAYVGNAGQLVMVIQPAGQPGTYTGYFEVSGQQLQLQATGNAQAIEGVYLYNGSQVPFYAENYQDSVYLIDGSDNTEYLLERANAAPR